MCTSKPISFIFFLNLFIYFWLSWVFVSVRGLSLVAASRGHSSSRCTGLSLSRPLLLRSTASRRAGSVVVAHGPSCSVACGIFPDQGSNPCPLHWQADSQPLCHQGNPILHFWQPMCIVSSWIFAQEGWVRPKKILVIWINIQIAHKWRLDRNGLCLPPGYELLEGRGKDLIHLRWIFRSYSSLPPCTGGYMVTFT